jgi:hypothetical protein
LAVSDKAYYRGQKEAEVHDFGTYPYLTIAGHCAPEDYEFLSAIEKIYKVAYAIKFLQKADDLDFKVPKMECEWWINGEDQSQFAATPREEWCWRIMIRMPISVSESVYEDGMNVAKKKSKGIDLSGVKYEIVEQGLSVQCLHLGSYEEEEATIAKILDLMEREGLVHNGYHKEIYLSDPRKTPEERLKTIIRHPVR